MSWASFQFPGCYYLQCTQYYRNMLRKSYWAPDPLKNKTLSDILHSTACKQSDSRVDPNARSLDSERLECAPIDRSGCFYECARYCSELVNEWISDSSECSDVSELLFERALYIDGQDSGAFNLLKFFYHTSKKERHKLKGAVYIKMLKPPCSNI